MSVPETNGVWRVSDNIMQKEDILSLSARMGDVRYPHLGGDVYREFAEMMLLRKVPWIEWKNAILRGYKHVLLYWQQSFFKSSLIESFFGLGPWEKRGLVIVDKIISPHSFTPQRFRGSVIRDQGRPKFLLPYPVVADVICIDELLAFLGTGEVKSAMLPLLNSIMESGKGGVDLVKMGDLDLKDIPKEWRDKFSFTPAGIEYDARCSLVAATHTLHPMMLNSLHRFGHLSRYDIYAFPFGESTTFNLLKEFIMNKTENADELLRTVQQAWVWMSKIAIEDVQPPAPEYVYEVVKMLETKSKEVRDAGIDWIDAKYYIDGRLIGRIIRKFVARAIALLPQRYGRIDFAYPELKYEWDDVGVVFQSCAKNYLSMCTAFADVEDVEMAMCSAYDRASGSEVDKLKELSEKAMIPVEIVKSYVRRV